MTQWSLALLCTFAGKSQLALQFTAGCLPSLIYGLYSLGQAIQPRSHMHMCAAPQHSCCRLLHSLLMLATPGKSKVPYSVIP